MCTSKCKEKLAFQDNTIQVFILLLKRKTVWGLQGENPGGIKLPIEEETSLEMDSTSKHIEDLKQEVARLQASLDVAIGENEQSGQIGLTLLHEKASLEKRVEELEILYEHSKQDLDITQQVSDLPLTYHLKKEFKSYLRFSCGVHCQVDWPQRLWVQIPTKKENCL